MSHVAFFDMDGTLTEARKKISDEMIVAINDLSKYCHIGIVTGSGFSYVEEQAGEKPSRWGLHRAIPM